MYTKVRCTVTGYIHLP